MAGEIAIVGLACRFPGARDARAFWRNLRDGVESIRFFSRAELIDAGVDPAELDHPDYVRAAPVLEDVEHFDAAHFGYSPREARLLDPQHRLFLEVCWEALEDAGYSPDAHSGHTGVFAGAGGVMTSWLLANAGSHPEVIGSTGSLQHICNDKDFLATRVSYKLNLKGPSLTVQTACSTSLVAVHLACRSLADGECDMALAGAATVRFPHFAGYRRQKGDILSPDGHCRAFDAQAEGTIFGSGAGAVLLKTLERALADGDHVYAVIRSTAVGNDGAEKTSYTSSSVAGQARTIAEALTLAGVPPGSVDFVECHGTGTFVGDPLELQALARAFGPLSERARPCRIGSVKTNIGHIEQAAGVAGLIKAALSLERGVLPASLWCRDPNPRFDWVQNGFFVGTSAAEWPRGPCPRRAGVNALGLGGTNAFVILEEAPLRARPASAEEPAGPHVFALSGRTETAVARYASILADELRARPELDLADVAFTLGASRSRGSVRRAVVASSTGELLAHLDRLEIPPTPSGPIAFLFPGQGSQSWNMARSLYDRQPTFRAALDRCAEALDLHLSVGVRDALFGRDPDLINDTALTQPCLFAVEVALSELWRSFGVVPQAVLGHSVGEIAAAHVSGALQLEEACRFVARRGVLMGSLREPGAMASVFASPADVEKLLAATKDRLSIAAVNGPSSVVVSGPTGAMDALVAEAERRNVIVRRLRVSHAFHSALMDPVLDALEDEAARLQPRAPGLALVANLTGDTVTQPIPARDWREQARRPVRFADGVATLARLGIRTLIEVGPGHTLQALGKAAWTEGPATWCGSLDGGANGAGDEKAFATALRAACLAGADLDWAAIEARAAPRRVSLPARPFERQPFALPAPRVAPRAPKVFEIPMLGRMLASPLDDLQFEAAYSPDTLSWVADHRIHGMVVLPTAGALEAARSAAERLFETDQVILEEVNYREALVLPEDGELVVQLLIGRDGGFRLMSRPNDRTGAPWRLHVIGRARRAASEAPPTDLTAVRARCTRSIEPAIFYERARKGGLEYGPQFQGIRELRLGDGEAWTHVSLPAGVGDGFGIHPALLDASLHVYAALDPDDGALAYLPIRVERFRLDRKGMSEVFVHAQRRSVGGEHVVDIAMYGLDGSVVGRLHGLTLRRLPREAIAPRGLAEDWLYRVEWRAIQPRGQSDRPDERWLILADEGGLGADLARRLAARGETVQLRRRAEGLDGLARADRVVFLWGLDDPRRAGIVEAMALLRLVPELGARIHLVTAAAWSIGDVIADPRQAQLWGLGRSAAHELGRAWGGLIDVIPQQGAAGLVDALAFRAEPELVVRRDSWFAPRLRPAPRAAATAPPIRADATYLVTGGHGALGTLIVRRLVAAGARHVAVFSRSGAPVPDLATELGHEVEIRPMACDVADVARLGESLEAVARRMPSLAGVFHCAGLLDDATIHRMSAEQLERVLRPKVDGGWNLHEQTRELPLEHFVLFSSILSIIGSAGQANYTAANACLDALALSRRAQGLPAMSINWGPWAETGLAVRSGQRGEDIWRARGTRYISPDQGRDAFDMLLRRADDQLAVTITDWRVLLGTFDQPPPIYSELGVKAEPVRRNSTDREVAALVERVRQASGSERRAVATEVIERCAREILERETPIDPSQPLADLGMDSLMAVSLANRLMSLLGAELPVRLLLEGPSVASIVDRLYPEDAATAAPPIADEGAGAVSPAPTAPGSWVIRSMPNDAAAHRLLCFPFAGGGSAVFHDWSARLGPTVDVCAIEPPGRLRRIREAPVTRMADFVKGAVEGLTPLTDRPYACFGHCLGGLTMFEVLRELRAAGKPLPTHVFVAGARPPHRLARQGTFELDLMQRLSGRPEFQASVPLHEQPVPIFAEVMRAFRIEETDQLLSDPSLRDLMMPALRAEFGMASRYIPKPSKPFGFPLTIFQGNDDPYVSREDALAWGDLTSGDVVLHTRPGAHFLLKNDAGFLLETMSRTLAPGQRGMT